MIGAVTTHHVIGGTVVPALLLGVLAGIVGRGSRGRTAEPVRRLR